MVKTQQVDPFEKWAPSLTIASFDEFQSIFEPKANFKDPFVDLGKRPGNYTFSASLLLTQDAHKRRVSHLMTGA